MLPVNLRQKRRSIRDRQADFPTYRIMTTAATVIGISRGNVKVCSAMIYPAEPSVSAENPELHHYTNRGGLEGIWKSGVLFATRFDFLNDRTEVVHLRNDLIRAVQDRVRAERLRLKRTDPKVARVLAKAKGAPSIAQEEANNVVSVIYQATFEGSTLGGGFAVPYITSFCSHRGDHKYEQQNGLLSQWRGYGGDERYAIVFQSKGLEKLLKQEGSKFTYPALNFGDVVYNDETLDFDHHYAELIDLFFGFWPDQRESIDKTKPDKLFRPFVMAATRMKHRGFREEREVRIVACPTFKDFDERMHRAAQTVIKPGTQHKDPHHYVRPNGTDVPIHTFIRLEKWKVPPYYADYRGTPSRSKRAQAASGEHDQAYRPSNLC
jgi:hypothetical protein